MLIEADLLYDEFDTEMGDIVGLMLMPHTDENVTPGYGKDAGRILAHDILEHFPGCVGGVENEIEALGASSWIRGITGGFDNPHYSPQETLGWDTCLALSYLYGDDAIAIGDPGDLPYEEWDEFCREVAVRGARSWVAEYAGNGLGRAPMSVWQIYYRLKQGWLKAMQRFEGMDEIDAYGLFEHTRQVINEAMPRFEEYMYGTTAKLVIDSENPNQSRLTIIEQWEEEY